MLCSAGVSQVRFEDVVDATMRDFERRGCDLGAFLGDEWKILLQCRIRETKSAQRSGFAAKETMR